MAATSCTLRAAVAVKNSACFASRPSSAENSQNRFSSPSTQIASLKSSQVCTCRRTVRPFARFSKSRLVVSASSASAVTLVNQGTASSASSPISPTALVIAAVAAASATAAAVARVVFEPLRALFAPLDSAEQLRLDGLMGGHKLLSATRRIVACSAPLFFAAIGQSGGGGSSTSTPLTVVASGMAKWLELYSGLLLVRVLLSWFPNIDWERQPMQAIRDMSDPYLNLFRNILPPFFGALDLSPMLAFLVLGMLTSLLNTTVFT